MVTVNASPQEAKHDTLRTILEFVAKCFYPAILVALVFLLYPKIDDIDFRSLLNRLQSAKAGDYEFTFGEAEKVGAEFAPLNRKVVELELALSNLKAQLPKAEAVPPEKLRELQQKAQSFKANGAYTALVFHGAMSREPAGAIATMLLKVGFAASDTETDFSELQKIRPKSGTAYITFTKDGEQVAEEIKSRILELNVVKEVNLNPRPIALKRGDLQVLVF